MVLQNLAVIAHDLRSTHNVGSLLRTADGLGVAKVWLSGYTPYPAHAGDRRLPHIARKLDAQIHKTALGAELSVAWEHQADLTSLVADLQGAGYTLCALEQAAGAVSLPDFRPPQTDKICLLLGNETAGLDKSALTLADIIVEIPMRGHKESFNVIQAAAMALYHLAYRSRS
jgi:23S rRNA (guanosine2251-2'-O)-methyltransferase